MSDFERMLDRIEEKVVASLAGRAAGAVARKVIGRVPVIGQRTAAKSFLGQYVDPVLRDIEAQLKNVADRRNTEQSFAALQQDIPRLTRGLRDLFAKYRPTIEQRGVDLGRFSARYGAWLKAVEDFEQLMAGVTAAAQAGYKPPPPAAQRRTEAAEPPTLPKATPKPKAAPAEPAPGRASTEMTRAVAGLIQHYKLMAAAVSDLRKALGVI